MKYSKLLIPVAALFALSSCSPKVSSGVAATDNSSTTTSSSSTTLSAEETQQKANISVQAQGEAKDMKPSSAAAAAPSY